MDSFLSLFNALVWFSFCIFLVIELVRSIRLVPTQHSFIVERFGRYLKTLEPGFHALIPFVDRVVYQQDLREQTIDVPPQECFSKDEVKVIVDGVLYLSVMDPVRASYGVVNYTYAAVQLAQTTTRSVIGTLELDRTFEERDLISAKIIQELDQAGEMWGLRVHRYEIKNIKPPESVRNAMERQVSAERERRAILARSEGDKQSRINMSEGKKMEMINLSEGQMQRRINEAEGKAQEIRTLASATAESISKIAQVLSEEGGEKAMELQLSEKYLEQMSFLSHSSTQVYLPKDLMNFNSWIQDLDLKKESLKE